MILEAVFLWHLFFAGKGFVSWNLDNQGNHQYVSDRSLAKAYPTKEDAESDLKPGEILTATVNNQ
jgi:hypothetical protein